jgi:hypothetical protein
MGFLFRVMAGLVPAISMGSAQHFDITGTRPVMTSCEIGQ